MDVVGDGPLEPALRHAVHQAGLDDVVVLRGAAVPDQVRMLLREADVFCLPSFAEGLPIAIMEAMAMGIPVVATHIGGIPELAVHRDTALLVPAGNASALADALAEVVTDAELRRGLVERARAAVAQRHEIASCAAELAGVFAGAGSSGQ